MSELRPGMPAGIWRRRRLAPHHTAGYAGRAFLTRPAAVAIPWIFQETSVWRGWADEYPQGAGRICNAPSSRTAALGIGPYNHDRKCGTRSKKRADRVVRPYKRCGVNRKSGQGVCPCNTKTQPSSMDGCVLIWDVIRPSVCRKSSCAWAARPRRLRPRACGAAPSALWSASLASRRRR